MPTVKEDREYYCPTCLAGEGLMIAYCNIQPTPGSSGCDCANNYCSNWIDNDVCDWTEGILVCRAVCRDFTGSACANVLSTGLLSYSSSPSYSTLGNTRTETFPEIKDELNRRIRLGIKEPILQILDYVPVGGCCVNNNECSSNKCEQTSHSKYDCSQTGKECVLSKAPIKTEDGNIVLESCIADADCEGRCFSGICTYMGDISGNTVDQKPKPDGIVNILDIFVVAQAFDSKGDPYYNLTRLDIDGDGDIDVNEVSEIGRKIWCNNTMMVSDPAKPNCDEQIIGGVKFPSCIGDNWKNYCAKLDVDETGAIDESDLYLIGINLKKQITPKYKQEADVNKDGKINILDIFIVAKNFGKVITTTTTVPATTTMPLF
jgi:hypothetical protein